MIGRPERLIEARVAEADELVERYEDLAEAIREIATGDAETGAEAEAVAS